MKVYKIQHNQDFDLNDAVRFVAQKFGMSGSIKEEDSIRKAEAAITVAQIQAESKMEDTEVPEMETPEDNSLDIAKLNFEREKFVRETSLKNAQQREVERANKKAEEFKEQEIAIKRKVANKPRSTSSK